MGVTTAGRSLPIVTEEPTHPYEPSLLRRALAAPGLTVMTGAIDHLLEWGLTNSLWVFPMATSCCGIELMAAAASRVDLDRMGTIVRATPRQADVMVVAGTITTKMAPRVLALWEQMPEPKWCIAMGSCAISGDFYRNLYSVVPGIDTVLPVDVYVPGCPPNPEALMHGLLRLQEKVRAAREGKAMARDPKPAIDLTRPTVARVGDPARTASVGAAQEDAAMKASSVDASDERGEDAEAAPAPRADRVDGATDLETLFREHGATEMPKDAPPIVDRARHLALAARLRAAGFVQLVYVVATHWPEKTKPKPQKERIEVSYALRTIGKSSRLASWRIVLEDGAAAPSLVGVFAGADWQEREQFDLVGVRFEGHPDMRRIMMADDYDGHPLRRDFPADKGCPPWR